MQGCSQVLQQRLGLGGMAEGVRRQQARRGCQQIQQLLLHASVCLLLLLLLLWITAG